MTAYALYVAAFLLLAPSAAAQTPADRFVAAAQAGDHARLLSALEELRKLGEPIGVEALYFEARALRAGGAGEKARAALAAYLAGAGEHGAYHEEALTLDKVLRADAERGAILTRLSLAYGAPLRPLGRVVRVDTEWNYAVVSLEGPPPAVGAPLAVVLSPDAPPLSARVGRVKDASITFAVASPTDAPVGSQVYAADGDPSEGEPR